ncbi:TetR/AcrR family transcriptional regulator [Rothia sp. ZJ932]|nr:TetR/AcrR family transcriptional regulator [Rothia sp. ZJ1223]QRZ62506.1 TetR/AcrR family transcriptional regulator [Rothia sp. ZJ932]
MREKGSEATTVEEVAERAGVSKGTVYYNFGSKKTIVDQLLKYGSKLLINEINRGRSADDTREGLEIACRSAFEFLGEHRGFARLWISEVWQNPEEWSPTMREARNQVVVAIRRLVQLLATQYTVDATRSPDTVAVALFGAAFMLSMDQEVHNADLGVADATQAAMLVIDGYITGIHPTFVHLNNARI